MESLSAAGHEAWQGLSRLLAALLFAAVLGWEREWRRKPAGLRTHMLVSLGAAGFTLATLGLFESVAAHEAPAARVDPIGVVQGVVGGIGFLGAGSIIQSRGSVAGLTTAASVWLVGAVGVACGAGFLVWAAELACLGLLVLLGLGALERAAEQSTS